MQQTQPGVGPYQLFMLALCVLVLSMLMADTFFSLQPETTAILGVVDTAICFVFLLDFAYGFLSASKRLSYLKWGWIDLVSSIPLVGPLRWGRFARVLRILRLLRGVRSVKRLTAFVLARRAQAAFTAVAFTAIVLIIFSSIAILEFEKDTGANISTPGDALWWSFVTITTVGYGDTYPISSEGRIIAAVLMTVGVGVFGTFTGFVASWFMAPGEKEQDNELQAIHKQLQEIRTLVETPHAQQKR